MDSAQIEKEFLAARRSHNRWFWASRLAGVGLGVHYGGLVHDAPDKALLASGLGYLLADSLWAMCLRSWNPFDVIRRFHVAYQMMQQRDGEEMHMSLREAVKNSKDPFKVLEERAEHAIIDGDLDESFLLAREGYRLRAKYPLRRGFFDRVLPLLSWGLVYGLSYHMPNRLANDLSLIRSATKQSLLHPFISHCFDRALEHSPQYSPELDLLRALWFESVHDDRSTVFLRRSLDGLMQRDNLSFVSDFSHRNETLLFQGSSLLGDAYFFKRAQDAGRLQNEFVIAKGLCEQVQHDNYDTHAVCEEPLGLFDVGGTVLVTRRVNRPSLDELLVDGQNIDNEYVSAVQNSLVIAAAGESLKDGLSVHDYHEEFSRRVVRRWHVDPLEYDPFLSRLESLSNALPKVFAHRDAALSNVLQGGVWVDFETAGSADPLLDVASLSVMAVDGARFFERVWPLLASQYPSLPRSSAEELFYRVRVHNGLCQIAAASERRAPHDDFRMQWCSLSVRASARQISSGLLDMVEKYVTPVLVS
ncbi:MAG TPA: phosphotransferase [Candidatus Nanoarchaeia archaeon]|nr:phosphotransferase [Candidatus Nanoarchaeia archaeon]